MDNSPVRAFPGKQNLRQAGNQQNKEIMNKSYPTGRNAIKRVQ
jgi:hypothetical protein